MLLKKCVLPAEIALYSIHALLVDKTKQTNKQSLMLIGAPIICRANENMLCLILPLEWRASTLTLADNPHREDLKKQCFFFTWPGTLICNRVSAKGKTIEQRLKVQTRRGFWSLLQHLSLEFHFPRTHWSYHLRISESVKPITLPFVSSATGSHKGSSRSKYVPEHLLTSLFLQFNEGNM